MNILIYTIPGDQHAHAVKWLMEKRGHRVFLFSAYGYPSRKNINLHLDRSGAHLAELDSDFDIFLLRRTRSALLAPELDPADIAHASRESAVVLDSLPELIAGSAFCVNPPAGLKRSNNKLIQLQRAQRHGLDVPDTLVSNDADCIRDFAERQRAIVYKGFNPAAWSGSQGEHLLFTTALTMEQIIEHAESLSLSPGIFQQQIQKDHEVRAVFMGHTCVAMSVGCASGRAATDWRRHYYDGAGIALKLVELPSAVYQRCLALMRDLDIVFGCFDFCVDQGGRYVFLEVNTMGQFLWMESGVEISLLGMFCDFLESRDREFVASAGARPGERFEDALLAADFIESVRSSQQQGELSQLDSYTYQES